MWPQPLLGDTWLRGDEKQVIDLEWPYVTTTTFRGYPIAS